MGYGLLRADSQRWYKLQLFLCVRGIVFLRAQEVIQHIRILIEIACRNLERGLSVLTLSAAKSMVKVETAEKTVTA
jgi:hypothetical protein